jgi:hypothetical protein
VLKESNSVELINNEELDTREKLIEDRNRTSHAYHEQLAETIAHRISNYYHLMHTVAQRLET